MTIQTKYCLNCNKPIKKEKNLSNNGLWKRVKYCSTKCARTDPYKLAKKHNLTTEEYISLKKKCSICNWKHNINIHHIIPKKNNGLDSIKNYWGLCPNCHKLAHCNFSFKEIKDIVKIHNEGVFFDKEKQGRI